MKSNFSIITPIILAFLANNMYGCAPTGSLTLPRFPVKSEIFGEPSISEYPNDQDCAIIKIYRPVAFVSAAVTFLIAATSYGQGCDQF